MPSYTATAFKWTGTHYNAVYDTSHTVTFTDNDGQYEGGGDGDERVSIDNGPDTATMSQPYSIDVSFTDTSGVDHVETFQFFNANGEWYFVPEPGSEFTEGARLGNYQSHTVGWDYDSIACYASGTQIQALQGPKWVEELQPGDLLQTWDGTPTTVVRLAESRVTVFEMHHCETLRPVRIAAGALGAGLPRQELMVSRQHRILMRSRIAERMFGTPEVLVAAARLLELDGVEVILPDQDMTYCHILCDRHAVLLAEGAPSESLLMGDRVTDILSARDVAAIERTGRAVGTEPARLIPSRLRQKKLVERHLAKRRPALSLNGLDAKPVLSQQRVRPG